MMRCLRSLSGQSDYKTLDISAQAKEEPFTFQVDWRDLEPVPWSNKNYGIGSEPANRLMYWCASKAGRVLQILHRKILTGF
jgi:hypothetical protein